MIDGLNRALERVEEQLTGEVDVDELARDVATSTYHLRRMFSSLAGLSLSTYVRRRRMTLAAAGIEALSDHEPSGILAVTHVHDPDRGEGSDVDYYHAAVTTQPVPDDLDSQHVPAASWAVFEVTGPFPDALQRLWADTAAVWFPSNPYRSVHAPELLRMELAEDQATARCELWIMVEPERAT